jgi:hypothetical protein
MSPRRTVVAPFGLAITRGASRRVAICLAFLAPFFCSSPAGVVEAWVQRYSNVVSNSEDQAFKILRDPAGDVFVVGTIDELSSGGGGIDVLTIKYSGDERGCVVATPLRWAGTRE